MKRKAYPLRINPDVLAAMQRWANDDLRSLNAQIEYVLRDSLKQVGRFKQSGTPSNEPESGSEENT